MPSKPVSSKVKLQLRGRSDTPQPSTKRGRSAASAAGAMPSKKARYSGESKTGNHDSDTQTSNPSDPTSETGYEQAEDASQQSIELGDTQEHGITREIEESPQHSVELGSTQEHETMTHDEGFSQQSVELASTQEHGTTLEDEESSQQPIELASTQEHGTTLEDEESSQQSIELGSMQEQGLTAENEEVDGGTRDDVRDEDPRYAGQISNPAGLSYAVTGRLIVGSSVNMQLAKDQYIHVIVEKDRVGSDRDSKQAVQLTLYVADEARMRQLSETFSAQHVRQASQDAQSEDGPSRSARARARAQESRSRKSREAFERLFNQRLQSAHADIERGEDAEGHNKEDQMDLKGEID